MDLKRREQDNTKRVSWKARGAVKDLRLRGQREARKRMDMGGWREVQIKRSEDGTV